MKTTLRPRTVVIEQCRNVSKTLTLCIMLLSPLLFLGEGLGVKCFAQGTGAGNCLSFNGTSDYVSVPDNDDWYFGSGDFTITAWIKLNTLSVGVAATIVSQYVDYCTNGGQLLYFSSTQGLVWDASCVMAFVQGNITGWTAGQWYHVAVVRNGNNFNLYRNGQSIANTTYSGSLPNYPRPLEIGSTYLYPQFFPGSIDEVTIWKNKGLTQTEIRDNMCKKLTGSESGLVGYWRFDEGSGGTVYDASGNGNDGTLY